MLPAAQEHGPVKVQYEDDIVTILDNGVLYALEVTRWRLCSDRAQIIPIEGLDEAGNVRSVTRSNLVSERFLEYIESDLLWEGW